MSLSTYFNSEKRSKENVEFSSLVDVDDQRIVDMTGQSGSAEGSWLDARIVPTLDLHRSDQQFVILLDLAGVDPNAVKISVRDGLLTVSGDRDVSVPGFRLVRSEIISSSFERVVRLPGDADKDQVNAHYRNGVLEVTIGRMETETSQRLAVESPVAGKRKVGS